MMKKRLMHSTGTIITLCFLLSACSAKQKTTMAPANGALSAIQTIDGLTTNTAIRPTTKRNPALLGVFVSEYLTTAPSAVAAESALLGVGAQAQILYAQQTIQDPDYKLLQAFGDALQVDVAELLNRSTDRQEVLETYTQALTNVATRSNDRFKELSSQLEELRKQASIQNHDRSLADRELHKALKDKDFESAGERQKKLTELQAVYAETDLKRRQVQSLKDTLDDLLTLYGKKILAIQQNREALIAGIKVIDVPGADELQVLEKKRASRTTNRAEGYDPLFNEPILNP